MVGRWIVNIINHIRPKGSVFVEPFVGGFNIGSQISGVVQCSDINPYLIALYQKMMEGWTPPSEVSRDEYQRLRALRNSDQEMYLVGS